MTLVAMSMFSFAQTNQVEFRIERRLNRLNELVASGELYRLRPDTKEAVLSHINQAISAILRNDPGTNPGPGPQPSFFSATAIVENHLIEFKGMSNAEIFTQCIQNVPEMRADEITLVGGNSNVKRLYNSSSYWSGKESICSVIMENLNLNFSPLSKPILVYGSIEDRSFNITANSKAEVLARCFSFANGSAKADDILIGVNNDPMRKLRNNSSWWTTPSAICYEIMTVVDASPSVF